MPRLYWLLLTLGAIRLAAAPPTAAELARSIGGVELDASECYRVRDLSFTKDDIRIYLNDGYLIFAKPILGQRLAAVFTADVEGGDAEVIVIPPSRSERQSLAGYTHSPNLDEHLRAALMVFSDGTGAELLKRMANEGTGKKAPEIGAVMAGEWTPVVANIAGPMQMRLVQDLLGPASADTGLLFMAVTGKTLGNFDIVWDARAGHRIAVRQRTERDSKPVTDVWTSFPGRSVRTGPRRDIAAEFTAPSFVIDSTIDPNLHVRARTRVKIRVGAAATRILPFEIAHAMQVTAAKIDGSPVELLRGDSPRGRIVARGEQELFLTVAPEELAPNSEHEIEFEHDGDVISTAGDGVYFVDARGSWYPHLGSRFATYDLTFRYPKRLTLVASGDAVEDRIEGETRITQRRSSTPIGSAGFNLGEYEKVAGTAAGVSFEVYGNRHLEEALKPKIAYSTPIAVAPGRGARVGRVGADSVVPVMPTAADPLGRFSAVAAEVSSALEFFSATFGPPALKTLTVAPIPGTFGQGFPGLVYLSTFAYLDPQERPAALRNAREEVFFSDLITAHEVAHQWWGSAVAVSRTEDDWLLEALANYSSLLWLEKKKGAKEVDLVLEGYRGELLTEAFEHRTPESAGPIVWGDRLEASQIPDAWRAITYGKGAWIMHMLRRRMGDAPFLKMLSELRRRYEFKTVTTDDFRLLVQEMRPARLTAESIDTFFDNWVYATGVPALKMRYTLKGVAPAVRLTGTVTQSAVDDDFSVDVPVEVQFAKGAPQTIWVRTSSEGEPFSATLRQAPSRVILPNDVLMKK